MSTKQLDTGRVSVQWTESPGSHTLVFDGQIDERCDLASLASCINGTVMIDLARVSFINSLGVRDWIRMLRAFDERGVSVNLRNCSEALVYQMNMIIEAQQGARVTSFYAPYECDGCGNESSIVLDVGEHRDALARMQPPDVGCPECGEDMHFCEFADRYLVFLERELQGGTSLA